MAYSRPVTRFLACMVVLLLGLASAHYLPAAAASGDVPALTRLARQLQDSPMPMRSDFAWLALTQMAAFYTEQAERARLETRATPRARETAKWAASVDAYADRIAVLADSISNESAITISVGISNEVHVYVDGQPVILTAAISSQQAAYESRVLERYCILYICEDLLQDADFDEPALAAEYVTTDPGLAYWSFSQHSGPVCMTNDGLEFQFQQLSDLTMKRAACSQVVAELSALASALAREQQQGASINWKSLAVHPASPETDNRVSISMHEDIHLRLPTLAGLPQLLKMVRPWLTARVRGDTFQLVVLNAEYLLGLKEPAEPEAGIQRYPAFRKEYE
jgi:HPt (histidine-containing phosphotransfer) domain-containing protein